MQSEATSPDSFRNGGGDHAPGDPDESVSRTTSSLIASCSRGNERMREIGDLAVWTLSTAKPGNGVDLLRDGNLGTYWQSDGPLPHLVNIQFPEKVKVSEVAIYIDSKADESYTPCRICIRVGNNPHELREVTTMELDSPQGWQRCRLSENPNLSGAPNSWKNGKAYIRAFAVQIAVLANHQNGRDTHIRQIKIFGQLNGRNLEQLDALPSSFSQYASVR